MPTWPASLPPFLRAGFEAGDQDPVQRFQPDYGEPMQRVGSTAIASPRSGTMRLTAAERDALRDFWKDDCGLGGLSFTMTDPMTGASGSYVFTAPPGPPRAAPAGRWLVEISILRLP